MNITSARYIDSNKTVIEIRVDDLIKHVPACKGNRYYDALISGNIHISTKGSTTDTS